MKYEVHFRRDYSNKRYFSSTGEQYSTLEEAKAARTVAGDLVVDAVTHDIIVDDTWLWDWERSTDTAYARLVIMWQKRVNNSN